METSSGLNTLRTVAVRFKTAGKLFYFNAGELELNSDDWVVVDTGKGLEVGRVVLPPRLIEASSLAEPQPPVLRIATEQDIQRMGMLKSRSKEALVKCGERIKVYQLPMRLVDAEYNYDASRLTFYFTADNRVDFRQLVRDLASIFRTRIELRQIGPRDKAKMIGGVGKCGQTLCCSTWATEFPPVSVKMAKDQELPPVPSHLTGVCGRLLCCLSYEHGQYVDMKTHLPLVGERVCGSGGAGFVESRNILKGTVTLALENGLRQEVPYQEITRQEKEAARLVGGYDLAQNRMFEADDAGELAYLDDDN